MIFMVSLSLKLYKSLGIDQCTFKDIFNDGFMNPRKEFTSPLILKGKLNSYFSYYLTNFISLKFLFTRSHWQLIIICPINRVIVWFCSLHKKPSKEMKTLIQRYVFITNVMCFIMIIL